MAKHHACHWSGDESDGEGAECRQGAKQRIVAGEEHLTEHKRSRRGVDVEIVELDGGADKCGSRRSTRLVGRVHARPFLEL